MIWDEGTTIFYRCNAEMTHDTYCKKHGISWKKFIKSESDLILTIFRECDEREKTWSCAEDGCEEHAFYYIAYSRRENTDDSQSQKLRSVKG